MKQEIYFPCRIESENAFRRMNNVFATRNAEKKIKSVVVPMLSQLERRPLLLPDGRHNIFNIQFIRVSNSALDYGNWVGSCKTVEDCVANWIGIDDRHTAFRPVYLQQKGPRGFFGLRIVLDDLATGRDSVKHFGGAPTPLGPAMERPDWGRPGMRAAPKPKPPRKARKADIAQEVITVNCCAVLPWEQDESDDDAVVTELAPRLVPLCEAFTAAPPRLLMRSPAGEIVRLVPSVASLPPPFGKCWLYRAG